jgi:hypothetical protein
MSQFVNFIQPISFSITVLLWKQNSIWILFYFFQLMKRTKTKLVEKKRSSSLTSF